MDTQKFTCIRKCFHRGRVWTVGETLQSSPEAAPPAKSFKAGEVKKVVAPVAKDPRTFSEINKAQGKVSEPAKPDAGTMFD
jgi:hypothetical protein